MGLFDSFSGFLTDTVGNNMTNDPDDIRRTKKNLKRVGRFKDDGVDNTDNPILTRRLTNGLRAYQEDNGLKVDGVMKPKGETERSLYERATGDTADNVFAPPHSNDLGSIGFGGNISGTFGSSRDKAKADPDVFKLAGNTMPQSAVLQKIKHSVPVPKKKPGAGIVLPAYKEEWFKTRPKNEWQDWARITEFGNSLSSAEKKAFQDIFVAEGGMAQAPGGSAIAGVLQTTLDGLKNSGAISSVVQKHGQGVKTIDLDMQDIKTIYKEYFNDALSSASKGLTKLPWKHEVLSLAPKRS